MFHTYCEPRVNLQMVMWKPVHTAAHKSLSLIKNFTKWQPLPESYENQRSFQLLWCIVWWRLCVTYSWNATTSRNKWNESIPRGRLVFLPFFIDPPVHNNIFISPQHSFTVALSVWRVLSYVKLRVPFRQGRLRFIAKLLLNAPNFWLSFYFV